MRRRFDRRARRSASRSRPLSTGGASCHRRRRRTTQAASEMSATFCHRFALILQSVAWKVADQLGWSDTFDAEYVALTQLQADAFVTLDRHLARAVEDLVPVAPIEALS